LHSEADFEGIYARFFAPVRAKSLRVLADPQAANDVTQEAFLRLWQWGSRPDPDAPEGARTILAWLYRTSTRLAIDALRARRAAPIDDGADAVRLPCGADLAESLAARAAVAALAASANDDELHAAILCRVDGLSQPEAALVLGTSERTVRRLLARFDDRTGSIRRELAR
jgi:RNA polymerase sigma-70 factor (ECF subfamily)